MGFVNLSLRVRYDDVDQNNSLTTKGFLKYLLEAANLHSNMAGYGIDDIPNTNVNWIILNWKLHVYHYPCTNEAIHIRTWTRNNTNLYSYRDFEVIDNIGNRIAIATSKWILINNKTRKITKISDEIINSYGPVENNILNTNLDKLKEPSIEYTNTFNYTFMRRDLDTNKHVNNLNFFDFAIEALPIDVYENINFNDIEVFYKKQCFLNDKIACLYCLNNKNEHTVVIKSEDLKNLHAILIFKEKK